MSTAQPAFEGFHHVAIKVSDFDRSLKFYTEVVGLRPHRLWGEGDGRGALLDTGSGDCLELFAGGPKPPRPDGLWYHIALRSRACDALLARIRAAGTPVTMEPNDIRIPSTPPLPARIAFFTGPDGESIEIFQET